MVDCLSPALNKRDKCIRENKKCYGRPVRRFAIMDFAFICYLAVIARQIMCTVSAENSLSASHKRTRSCWSFFSSGYDYHNFHDMARRNHPFIANDPSSVWWFYCEVKLLSLRPDSRQNKFSLIRTFVKKYKCLAHAWHLIFYWIVSKSNKKFPVTFFKSDK